MATTRSEAADWATWRGPNLNGIAAAGQTPPVAWSESKNVVWKTAIPGRGHSSPTIIGNQIFLTTADEESQSQSVIAFDRNTGKQLWMTPISKGGFPETHRKNTRVHVRICADFGLR
jgi:outer membrane protein assembly factor BamB